MEILQQSNKENKYRGEEIIPGTRFGLKYKSARRYIQEGGNSPVEPTQPLVEIYNISDGVDQSRQVARDEDEEQDKKISKKLGKSRLEIPGLVHPDDMTPTHRKKTQAKRGESGNTQSKGEESKRYDVVSMVRSKQRLMYSHHGEENRCSLLNHHDSTTTTINHNYCQPLLSCLPQHHNLLAGPSMYPPHEMLTPRESTSTWYLSEGNSGWTHGWFSSVGRPGVCEGPPHPSGYEDTHQQQHDDAQQPREFNSGKYSLSERCDPLSGGDGYYMSTLSPHPPAKCCHMRDLPAVSRRYASFKRHTHEELPPSEPLYVKGSKRYSDRSVHPDFSSGQQIDDFRDFRDDSTSHSYLKKSFSAVEFLREVSKKLDHTTDETSQLLDGVETEDNNADSPGLFGTGNIRHCPSSSSSAWQSFVNNLETGEKRQGMMPVLFDDPEGGIKRSSNPFNRGNSDTHHDCPTTTSTARLNFPENTNTLHQHNTMNGSDEQVYNKQDYCSGENTRPVSPDLFASQDPYHTTTPPSFNLQNGNSSTPQRVYNSQHDPHESRAQGSGEQIHESIRHSLGREDCDTARESHIRFSPKISLTRTEDTYRRGLSGGMVRVSTVEGEMILNPRHWRLARTFTGLLGHKAQLVSSNLLDQEGHDLHHPQSLVASEELLQLYAHTS